MTSCDLSDGSCDLSCAGVSLEVSRSLSFVGVRREALTACRVVSKASFSFNTPLYALTTSIKRRDIY